MASIGSHTPEAVHVIEEGEMNEIHYETMSSLWWDSHNIPVKSKPFHHGQKSGAD